MPDTPLSASPCPPEGRGSAGVGADFLLCWRNGGRWSRRVVSGAVPPLEAPLIPLNEGAVPGRCK